MSIHHKPDTETGQDYLKDYLESLALVERLHRLWSLCRGLSDKG